MSQLTALDRCSAVVATRAYALPAADCGALRAPTRDPERVSEARASGRETGPTITAELEHGPLDGRRTEVDVVEGRPPKTIDLRADDGSMCRYCLAGWSQSGPSAQYTFLYLV